MSHIIGLIGVKGSGKDTCASHLIQEHGFLRLAFADRLYQETADAFGVTVEFLNNRDTKESPLLALALNNCGDPLFVQTAMDEAKEKGVHIDLNTPLSPRKVLQLWGTEFRRAQFADTYWTDIVVEQIKEQSRKDPSVGIVITDVRYENEAGLIESFGGELLRIRRPTLEEKEALDRAKNGTAAHNSETAMLNYPVAAELMNVEGEPKSLAIGVEKYLADSANDSEYRATKRLRP